MNSLKVFGCLAVFGVGLLISMTAFSQGEDKKEFSWLFGTWKREGLSSGKEAYETWQMKNGQLNGLGVSLNDGDTSFIEMLGIVSKDAKTYYVAEVAHNSSPIYFEITAQTSTGFISENPAHDFPKKIAYALQGEKMKVIISDGKKSRSFHFQRRDE
ncbi:MAG: DUF6265 family protein [Bacteroidota bacterium]